MSDNERPPRSWWIRVLVAVGVVGLVTFGVSAAVVAIPPVLANLNSEAATGLDELVLTADGEPRGVIVPEAWLITREDDATAIVTTPDGRMVVTATASALPPAEAAAGVSEPRTEVLASGLRVVHGGAPTRGGVDADGGADAVIAAVGTHDGGSIIFTAVSADMDRYRPALAELLEAVQP